MNTEEEEHLDAVGGPLEVVVANPEKSQTPMESYITYEVKTETNLALTHRELELDGAIGHFAEPL